MAPAQDDPKTQPHVRAVAKEISQRFGLAPALITGWRKTGSVPNSDHPRGLALDVMAPLIGNQISTWAINNAARLGITYIIWNRQIWQGGKWSRYSGPSPHTDHVHLSFSATPGSGGANVDSGESNIGGNGDDPMTGCLKALLDMLNPLA